MTTADGSPSLTAPALTALVLAGRRSRVDALAAAAGVAHKALLPAGGVPMVLRVIAALRGCPVVGRVVVSTVAADRVLEGAGAPDGVLERPAAASPSASVLAALAEFGAPLLVTTADHALLTPAVVACFVRTTPDDADAAAGLARSTTVLARFPGTRRTWMRFRDGAWSGCNLFLLRTPEAVRAVRFWSEVEERRKHPLAMARLLGPVALGGYALRLLSLPGALRLLERRVGCRLRAVDLPFAEAAIDVDKADDLALAEAILAARPDDAASGPAPLLAGLPT